MDRQLEYELLACRTLDLVHPTKREAFSDTLLELGYFLILESDDALDAVVEAHLGRLKSAAKKISENASAAYNRRSSNQGGQITSAVNEFKRAFHGRAILTYSDFETYHGREDSELRSGTNSSQMGAALIRSLARSRFAVMQQTFSFKRNRHGYREYLKHANAAFYERVSKPIMALVPDAPRRKHSYIVATTGTGKSELLKAMVLNYVQTSNYCGVVLLDPGGDMAEQIARWPELIPSGRLVYIDPTLDPDRVPVINPFDADHLDDQRKAVLTTQIVKAIGALVEGKLGGAISVNMEAVLYPAVRLLVDLPNANLKDLRLVMRDEPSVLEAGRMSANEAVREYFTYGYKQANLTTTKQSISTKIQNILGKGVLDRVLCGRSTLRLDKLLKQNKIILFNLSKGLLGEDESSALGTLVISLMQSIAQDRAQVPERQRPLTHVIVDEAQNFVTNAMIPIIEEARKFGMPLTLAQLTVGRGMSTELTQVVTSTTNVKVAGRSGRSETRRTSDLVNVSADDIANATQIGTFYYRNGIAPAFLLHTRVDRIEDKGGVSPAIWKRIKAQQIEQYYQIPPLADYTTPEVDEPADPLAAMTIEEPVAPAPPPAGKKSTLPTKRAAPPKAAPKSKPIPDSKKFI